MASVRTVTLPDGSVFTLSDWGDYPIWARAEILNTLAQEVLVFNYVRSQPIPGGGTAANATILDTNMPGPGALPLRHQMVVFSCQIRLDETDTDQTGANMADVEDTVWEGMYKWYNVSCNVFFQLVVENVKPYVEGVITQFPAGGGLYMLNNIHNEAAAPADEVYIPINGIPGAHAARRLAMPIHIGALEAFHGSFTFPRGALTFVAETPEDYALTVVLSGPRQRPIG